MEGDISNAYHKSQVNQWVKKFSKNFSVDVPVWVPPCPTKKTTGVPSHSFLQHPVLETAFPLPQITSAVPTTTRVSRHASNNFHIHIDQEINMKLTINIPKPKLTTVKSAYAKAMTTSPQDLVNKAKTVPSTTKAFVKHCRNFNA